MKLSWIIAAIAAITFAGATSATAQTFWQSTPGSAFSQNVVVEGTQIVGQDPDLFVRSQIQRDNSIRSGGNS